MIVAGAAVLPGAADAGASIAAHRAAAAPSCYDSQASEAFKHAAPALQLRIT
jgi:hypothetical protein